MRRADRLFEIIQVLRRVERPTSADAIARELEVSKRTVYRDIAALIAQRVPIRGEAGIGYVLDPGYDLPPLMLTEDEIDAAVLGASWVLSRGEPRLAAAACNLIVKLNAVIPHELRSFIDTPATSVAPVPAVKDRVEAREYATPFERGERSG